MFVQFARLLCHVTARFVHVKHSVYVKHARSPACRKAVALSTFACVACGSNPNAASSGPSLATRTTQAPLTQDAWQSLLAADPALSALATGQQNPWQAAGQIAGDDGATFAWAEFAPSADAPRTAVSAVWRSCPKVVAGSTPVCTLGTANYTSTGAQFIDNSTGKELGVLPIAAPQAWEWETSANLDNDNSTIVASLSGTDPPLDVDTVVAQFAAIVPHQRRCIVLSSYGPQLGVDIGPIVKAAQQSGRFDSVETIEYVRRSDVEALLPSLTALDAVIWVGAGVQQKPSQSSPPTKAVGMNVTRGVVGDETWYGKAAVLLLTAPPLGGPGLIVLAGQNTYLSDPSDTQSLAAVLYAPATRPIVGFSLPLGTPGATGYAHIAIPDVIGATAKLIGALGSGASLDAAMTTAASGRAFTLTSPMASDNRKKWSWSAPNGSFWATQPTTGGLTIQLGLVPQCVAPVATCGAGSWQSGTKVPQGAAMSVAIACDNPVFVGPYFSVQGCDSQPPGTKFAVTGVMTGTSLDDHMLIFAKGTSGGPLGGAVVLGDGVFNAAPDVGGGTTTYPFAGQANLSFYTDNGGNCCMTNPPWMASTTSSQLKIQN